MFISDTKKQRRHIFQTAFAYLLISLLCALFGFVYEQFSHEVYSFYMLYAFAFPLALGVLPFFTMALFVRRLPSRLPLNLYHSGLATLTVGSLFQGALEIYGTTSRLTTVYLLAGLAFTVSGILLYLIGLAASKNRQKAGSETSAAWQDS
ncbi:MAG: hypothetical protein Q4C04_04075 [Clostridia bacterium]|nr:hypothetical protein [Clostridia bacterium]